MKYKAWYDAGGDSACPPYAAPVLSDDDVVPVRGLSRLGGHSGGGENPVERFACNRAFHQSHFL